MLLSRQPSVSSARTRTKQQLQQSSAEAAWPPPPSLIVFLRNLRLLNFDLLPEWPEIDVQTFSSRDARPRLKAVEWALYHLFRLWDPQETANKLRPFFPPLEPLQSVNLRSALFRALSELKKNGILGRESILRKSMLDDCKGERFEEILATFSTVVLRKCLVAERHPALKSIEHDPENLLPLLLAHRVSIAGLIDDKSRLDKHYHDFGRLLRTKGDQLVERSKQQDQETDTQFLPDDLQKKIRHTWLGNDRWAEIVLEGGRQQDNDSLLELPFTQIWNGVSRGNIQDLGTQKLRDLLTDLDGRVTRQRDRLSRWKSFEQSLHEAAGPDEKATAQSKTGSSSSLTFRSHQQLSMASVLKARLQPSSAALLPAYDSLLLSMNTELDRVSGKRTKSGIKREKRTAPAAQEMQEHILTDDGLETTPTKPSSTATLQEMMSTLKLREDRFSRHSLESAGMVEGATPPPYAGSNKEDENMELVSPSGYDFSGMNEEDFTYPPSAPNFAPGHAPGNKAAHRSVSASPSSYDSDEHEAVEDEFDKLMQHTSPHKVRSSPPDSPQYHASPSPNKQEPSMSPNSHARQPIPTISEPFSPEEEEEDEALDSLPLPKASNRSHSNLIERTRQSMSLLPDAQTLRRQSLAAARRQSRQSRQSFPVNQFSDGKNHHSNHDEEGEMEEHEHESDNDGGNHEKIDPAAISRCSTPREDLFSQEADYNSVFKSRPRIAVSPTPEAGSMLGDDEMEMGEATPTPMPGGGGSYAYDDDDDDEEISYAYGSGGRRGGRKGGRISLGVDDLLDGLEESSMIQEMEVGSSPLGAKSRDYGGRGLPKRSGLRY